MMQSTVDNIMNGFKDVSHQFDSSYSYCSCNLMILMKKGTIVSMMSGTMVAILIMMFYQGYSVADMGDIFI